jgi:hypothetical protein
MLDMLAMRLIQSPLNSNSREAVRAVVRSCLKHGTFVTRKTDVIPKIQPTRWSIMSVIMSVITQGMLNA